MGRSALNTFQTVERSMRHMRRQIPIVSAALRLIILILLALDLRAEEARVYGLFFVLFFLLLLESVARFFSPHRAAFGAAALLEIFLFQTGGYSMPGMLRVEPLFIILGMLEISFYFPVKAAIAVNLLGGILLFPVQSCLFQQYMERPYAIRLGMDLPFYCVTLMISALMFCILSVFIDRQDSLFRSRDQEEAVYRNLDAINRSLSEEMFSIKSESEQKAKKEVTKYIHDNVGYVLTNLTMMLQATNAVNQVDKEQGQAMLTRCIDYSHSGLEEIRMFLRSIQRDMQAKINIRREIMELAKLFEKCTGTEVSIEFGAWPVSFTKEINSFFLSCVKECLTNAVKHGMASKVVIGCNAISEYIVGMSVSSNGTIPQGTIVYGMGLKSIQDAVDQLGGKLRISNTHDSFIVSVCVPYVTMQKDDV